MSHFPTDYFTARFATIALTGTLALLLCGCSTSGRGLSASAKSEAHGAACRITHILFELMKEDGSAVTPDMVQYVRSDAYKNLSSSQGRDHLQAAFNKARLVLDSKGGASETGSAIGEAHLNVIDACMAYRFEECVGSAGGQMPIPEVVKALDSLNACGRELWSK